jgi:hypothetical protein
LRRDLAAQVGRYAHARQFKRMRKALRQLKGYVGRVHRDLRRHLQDIPEGPLRGKVLEALWLVGRLLEQTPKSKNKIYSLHEPEVDCISKGKARIRYQFGTKVGLATTLDGGFVGARSFPGNPYDGHTLAPALEQVAILTEQVPDLAVVDRGYRGHGVETTKVLISGHKTWHHPAPGKAPQATKRHRAGDRAHEKRRSPGQMPAEGLHRRRNLCRPLRLRSQYPQDTRPSQDFLLPVASPDCGDDPAQNAPTTRSIGRLIRLFNADRASDQEANQEHQGRDYSRMLRANVLHYLPRPALLPLCLL